MRQSSIIRNTSETQIKLDLNIDGKGVSNISTGCGFLDHMLTLFARHGRFDLNIEAGGDTWVDFHHTAEDVGIALGEAFREALGDKCGIIRYGFFLLPMDEALIEAALDISGRCHLSYNMNIPAEKVGDFDTELAEEFFAAFTRRSEITLHLTQKAGKNSHHIIEGTFKAFARALRDACRIDPDFADEIPSTKGVL